MLDVALEYDSDQAMILVVSGLNRALVTDPHVATLHDIEARVL